MASNRRLEHNGSNRGFADSRASVRILEASTLVVSVKGPDLRVAAKPGAIILARHGEPALSRRVKLTAQGYRDWWSRYEEGGLLPGQTPPVAVRRAAEEAGVLVSSSRRRAIETARALWPDRPSAAEPLLIEAPLPPPLLPSFITLSPRTWGVIARIWWWFRGPVEGEESRSQAQARARLAADRLIAEAEGGLTVLVAAHGFFNAMVGTELKRRGWRLTRNGGFSYWSVRRFERT